MNYTRVLCSIVAATCLSACGGGSDDNNNPAPPTGGGGTTQTFQAVVVQQTECGTERVATHAELLVHDQNWRVLSRHKADSAGRISATISNSSTANVSIITYNNAAKAFNVSSMAQHPVRDLGKFYIPGQTAEGCECQLADVRVSSPTGELNSASVQLTGYQSAEQRKNQIAFNEVLFEQVRLCRAPNGNWPLLTAVANSGGMNAAAGSIRQYSPATEIVIALNQGVTVIPVTLNSGNASLTELHYTETGSFNARSRLNGNEVYLFNQLDGIDFVTIRAAENQFQSTGDGTILHSVSQRNNVTLPQTSTLALTVPFNDAHQALENFLSQDLLASHTNYNLGSVQGFNTFYFYAQTRLTDGTQYFQSFLGPLQGNYPDEVVPSDYGIESKFSEDAPSTVHVAVIRYGDSQSYQQFLLEQIERSKLPFKERMTGKWAKYTTVSIQINTQ